ncbi:MAG TPA: class I SAM-dependent methyltransferase [Bacteroidales bacterium]|nr:class I SAM-dependent methyltransferase [Bacteroidales bacterium]
MNAKTYTMKSFTGFYSTYKGKISRSLQGRGIFGTVILFPKRYFQRFRFRKLDFGGKIEPFELDGPEEVKEHAVRYEASDHIFFRRLFEDVDWPFRESIFVDFGCGKGASLVYASGFQFKKLIGVEFSQQLSDTAARNLAKHSARILKTIDYEIVNTDAGKYEVPEDADCFYFFNPFDAVILDRVLQNIVKSLEAKRRKILIVYMNAIHNDVLEKYPFRKVKYLSPKELDIYYTGGACVYTN